ncbi:hypothetical protein M2480_003173 [Parabacteroides sp. PFB2-12]|uniref:hypothetical protein n=1 Tax=unclassified Parabacteroides TaxID=2649774 RepID=UPI00247447D0|nr:MULTISPECIES: hypothetical protein [unclassified Parabacteroides]MDH6344219.1 hypothetical protein [Parabacteroides sp. PM6-13]MDH6392165.1 hypothetical protein [Parabacteroides sp. PFB2-12]
MNENIYLTDINDVLELYHVCKYIDNGCVLTKWTDEFKQKVNCFKPIVARFFNSLSKENLPEVFNSIEFSYKESFWEVIDKFDINNLLDENTLHAIVMKEPSRLREILHREKLVRKHGNVIEKLLMENDSSAELLLQQYVEEHHISDCKQLYFPKTLTLINREEIINRYLDKADANLNYVRLIALAKDSEQLAFSDKTKLKAKRKESELNQQILESGTPFRTTYTVTISMDKNAEVKCIKYDENGNPTLHYNGNIIQQISNFALIHYCQAAFGFTSNMGFIQLISKRNEAETLERIIGLKAKNTYPVYHSFQSKEYISQLQIAAMIYTLEIDGRRLEVAIKDFYENYLKKEYGYPAPSITIPSKDTTWIEKCRTLFAEMEAISKQYNLFVQEKEIDLELLMLGKPIGVTEVKSLLQKKYYAVDEDNKELNNIFHFLFGDQSMLTYIDPYKEKHYRCFYRLLREQSTIAFSNYKPYQQHGLQYLIDRKLLRVDNKGLIRVVDWDTIHILKHLNEYRACPYWYCTEKMYSSLDKMVEDGWIIESDYLLTPEERNYFSFYLNNEKYTNGYAYRNKYAHGSNPPPEKTGSHQAAYNRLLILFIILLLKIEEDLAISKIIGSGSKFVPQQVQHPD